MSDESTWITEENAHPEHGPQLRFGFRATHELHREQSDFQEVVVAEGPAYGRMLFLDGFMMTTERDEFVYHEMLSHVPLQIARQRGPVRRVLIIGGGDGGLAREILRYDSVEHVDLVEIDAAVIDVSRRFLPTIGRAFDDPRLHVRAEDGNAFIHAAEPGSYDVILVDSADPVGPGIVLFEPPFYTAVRDALTPHGVMAAQGMSPWLQREGQRMMFGNLGKVFGTVSAYVATIPTYPGGQWCFALCAAGELDPHDIDDDQADALTAGSHYYTAAVHHGALAVPPFARENTIDAAALSRAAQSTESAGA